MMNQCDGCQSGMAIKDGLHYYKGRVHISCQSKRYGSEQDKGLVKESINSPEIGEFMCRLSSKRN